MIFRSHAYTGELIYLRMEHDKIQFKRPLYPL